jgi:hypothetical protein
MKDLIESNLDKMDTQFLVLLTLRLLPEQYAAETLKLILKTETDETNETVRNSKIRILCKRVIRQEITRQDYLTNATLPKSTQP